MPSIREFAFRNEPVHSTRITRYKLRSCLLSSWLHCGLVFLFFSQNLWDFIKKEVKKGVVYSKLHTGAAPHHSFLLVLQIFIHRLCTNRKKFSVNIQISLGNSSFCCIQSIAFKKDTFGQSHYREVPRWGVSNGARHNWKCFLA